MSAREILEKIWIPEQKRDMGLPSEVLVWDSGVQHFQGENAKKIKGELTENPGISELLSWPDLEPTYLWTLGDAK